MDEKNRMLPEDNPKNPQEAPPENPMTENKDKDKKSTENTEGFQGETTEPSSKTGVKEPIEEQAEEPVEESAEEQIAEQPEEQTGKNGGEDSPEEDREKNKPDKKAGKHFRRKRSFWKAVFPCKGDSRRLVINKILCLICFAVFVVCAGILLNDLVLKPGAVSQQNQELSQIYHSSSKGEEESEGSGSGSQASEPERTEEGHLVKIENLREINPDIQGWITVPDTVIDLPVLQSSEAYPEYYLYKNYKKEYSFAGSIFLDSRCQLDDRALILFGHSLNSGLMFTPLLQYKNLDFYKERPVFTFDTVEDENQWKIFSVFLANTDASQGEPFNYMRVEFQDDTDFMNYVYQIRIRSLLETDVDFGPSDQLLLLSTCSYEYDGYRLVVAARKVREGEDPSVDVSKASYSSRTVFPENYRKDHGLADPGWPETYQEALEKGLLSWAVVE